MKKKILIIIVQIILLVFISCGTYNRNYETSSLLKEKGQIDINQPEFCGSCHMMKSYYDSWKKSKHGENGISCTVCHYASGEENGGKSNPGRFGNLIAYLSSGGQDIRMPTKVSDQSCMTSDCHPKEKFLLKEVNFTEKVHFIHKTHEEKTIEGQKMHCDTCHQSITSNKHFEVIKEICFLCHFKNTVFNEGRARCSICHKIPTESLQKQKKEGANSAEKPITHQSLEQAKVPCQSCHYELIQGKGEVKKQNCFNCHQYSFDIEIKAGEKKMMHTEHVSGQHVSGQLAKCFDCHEPIRHQMVEFLDSVRLNCLACHPDHHKYQKMLLSGKGGEGVPETPSLMNEVNTTCLGCHRSERVINGEKVVHGTGKACAACHTKNHEEMVKEWKDKIKEELESAKEKEQEALGAIERAKGKAPDKKLRQAQAMLKKGQENMQIVEYGGGVHNKKYSVMLLDTAMNNFEDLIDLLAEKPLPEKFPDVVKTLETDGIATIMQQAEKEKGGLRLP